MSVGVRYMHDAIGRRGDNFVTLFTAATKEDLLLVLLRERGKGNLDTNRRLIANRL